MVPWRIFLPLLEFWISSLSELKGKSKYRYSYKKKLFHAAIILREKLHPMSVSYEAL